GTGRSPYGCALPSGEMSGSVTGGGIHLRRSRSSGDGRTVSDRTGNQPLTDVAKKFQTRTYVRVGDGPSMSFVLLDVRSYSSLKEGAFAPEQGAEQAADLGLSAVAMTDRDGLYGAARFVSACQRNGVTPIL